MPLLKAFDARSHFEGKVAIVTGGASGIGRAVGKSLAEAGAEVVLADIDELGAKSTAEEIGRGATGTALDVTDAQSFADLVRTVADDHGRLDLLFNNAGVAVAGDAKDLPLGHWEHVMSVNLHGVVNGVVAAYPLMCRAGHGHIVNTASLAGLFPSPGLTPYATTKHAVVGLSTSLRAEAGTYGVKVSVLCPGFVKTPLLGKANAGLPEIPGGQVQGWERIERVAYSADSLARDVLAGVAANRAFIVAPANARILWRAYRLAPSLVLRGISIGARRVLRELHAS